MGCVGLCASRSVLSLIFLTAYYRYLNAHGRQTTAATAFLFVGEGLSYPVNRWHAKNRLSVAILDAGRNALSFFMLLVVSLGLSVVKETLGSTMLRCQILAIAHFIFGG